jgi:hypothetical protein
LTHSERAAMLRDSAEDSRDGAEWARGIRNAGGEVELSASSRRLRSPSLGRS